VTWVSNILSVDLQLDGFRMNRPSGHAVAALKPTLCGLDRTVDSFYRNERLCVADNGVDARRVG
jgi:hypothetical protein